MNKIHSLNDIKPGQKATVKELVSTGSIRRRLLDIGLVENTEVECLGRSPAGDPCAYLIRGAVIAIRSEDCRNILVQASYAKLLQPFRQRKIGAKIRLQASLTRLPAPIFPSSELLQNIIRKRSL